MKYRGLGIVNIETLEDARVAIAIAEDISMDKPILAESYFDTMPKITSKGGIDYGKCLFDNGSHEEFMYGVQDFADLAQTKRIVDIRTFLWEFV